MGEFLVGVWKNYQSEHRLYFSNIYIKIFKVKVAGFCDYCKTERSVGLLTVKNMKPLYVN
jgi:hypothetical protein